MRNCNTCLYYDSRGFCTIHHTVPGGCNDYRTGYEKNITSDMEEDKYIYSANLVAEITDQAIAFKENMMGVALGKWGYCKADIEKALVELEQYRKIGTLEECREAVNKTKPMKVRYENRHGEGPDWKNEDYFNCPSCGRRLRNKQRDDFCGKCGQKIGWRK